MARMQVLVFGGGGEHHNGRLARGGVRPVAQGREHGVPVQPGHVQVEQQDIGAGGGDDVDRLQAVSGLARDSMSGSWLSR